MALRAGVDARRSSTGPMTQTRTPVDLAFRVVKTPAEESREFSSTNLELVGRQHPGWHSARRCSFPQELGIAFDSPNTEVVALELLMHQYMIPRRVDVFVGSGGDSYETAHFRCLGYLTFDDNRQTMHQSREFKSAEINAVGVHYLRLVFRQCFRSDLNRFDQVGLVRLRGVGFGAAKPSPTIPATAWQHQNTGNLHAQRGIINSQPTDNNAHSHPQNFAAAQHAQDAVSPRRGEQNLGQLDPETMKILMHLKERKTTAIRLEDYDECKRLRKAESIVQSAGAQLSQLEIEKAAAVRAEEYGAAKALKEQISALRQNMLHSLDAVFMSPSVNSSRRGIEHHNDAVGPAQRSPTHATVPRTAPQHDHSSTVQRQSTGERHAQESAKPGIPAPESEIRAPRLPPPTTKQPRSAVEEQPLPGMKGTYDRATDNPFGKGNPVSPSNATTAAPQHEHGPPSHPTQRQKAKDPSGRKLIGDVGREHPLFGVPGAETFPEPKPLSKKDRDEFADVVTCFGEFLTRCLRDRSWQLRAASLRKMRDVHSRRQEVHPVIVPALKKVLSVALKDSVVHIFLHSLDLVTAILSDGPKLSLGNLKTVLSEYVAALLNKRAGDNNPRCATGAMDMLKTMTQHRVLGPSFVVSAALGSSVPTRTPKKVIVKRVEFLMWVLDNCDVQAACSSSRYGFPEDFIVFVKRSSLLQHQDKLVRMQAKRLIVSVASQVGYPEVESHLSDVPKKIRSEIEGMLEQAPSRGAATKKVGTKPTSASGAPRRDESPQQTDSEQRLHADADADNRSRSGNNGRYSSQPLRAENADERSSMEPRSANEALHPRSQQDHRRAGARDDHSFGAPVEPSFDSGDPGAVGERWAEESGSGSVEEPFTCTFCGRQDPSFTPEELDHHYWASCPMLMSCAFCEQIIEVEVLDEHMRQGECENANEVVECDRCRLFVWRDNLAAHQQTGGLCPGPAQHADTHFRCPLCYDEFPVGNGPDEAWHQHLHSCRSNVRLQF